MSKKDLWPELPYEKFKSTRHLLHMAAQAIGKLKLATPFEPHWANVPLWITSQGLTTGPIPQDSETFNIDIDLINHGVICTHSTGKKAHFKLKSMSVAEFANTLFETLNSLGIKPKINFLPQEVPDPIPFNQDDEVRTYIPELANAWWRIVENTHQVMQRYHSRFKGITPPIGLMWGTFDLRDARYVNVPVPTKGENAGYIRRNAMDVAQVEAGWWAGDERYEHPAYFSFTYPAPKGIEKSKIEPTAARFEKKLGEFLLDYEDIRKSKNPEEDLLAFFDSTYHAGTELAGWDPKLVGPGVPV